MKDTTQRGDVAELMAAAELVRRGYLVSRPLTNGAPYDLLVDTGPKIFRVQIKRAFPSETGTVRIKLSGDRAGYAGRADVVLAVACEATAFYVVQGEDLNQWNVRLRLTAGRANQHQYRLAEDYSIAVIFPNLGAAGAFEPAAPTVADTPHFENDNVSKWLSGAGEQNRTVDTDLGKSGCFQKTRTCDIVIIELFGLIGDTRCSGFQIK